MDPHVSLPTYPNPFNFAPTPFIPTDPAFSHPTRKHARTATLDILTLPTFDPKRCRTNPSALLHGDDPSRFYIPPHHLVQPVPSVAQSTLSESSSSTDSSSGESESESDENGERDSALGLGDGESTFTTSSSSSPSPSSSSSSSEDDSEATDTDSSSTLHPAMTPPPPSTLRTRLSAFLPSLRAANQALETERLAGTLNARNIENVEEKEGEGGQYIEMDLGLGVLEEKRDGDDDSGSDESWSEVDGPEEEREREREKDVLGRLMGIRQRKDARRPGIEVVGGGVS